MEREGEGERESKEIIKKKPGEERIRAESARQERAERVNMTEDLPFVRKTLSRDLKTSGNLGRRLLRDDTFAIHVILNEIIGRYKRKQLVMISSR